MKKFWDKLKKVKLTPKWSKKRLKNERDESSLEGDDEYHEDVDMDEEVDESVEQGPEESDQEQLQTQQEDGDHESQESPESPESQDTQDDDSEAPLEASNENSSAQDDLENKTREIPLDQLKQQWDQNHPAPEQEDEDEEEAGYFEADSPSLPKPSWHQGVVLKLKNLFKSNKSSSKSGVSKLNRPWKKLTSRLLAGFGRQSLQWEDVINSLFSPSRRPFYHQLFVIGLVLAISLALVKGLVPFLTPSAQVAKTPLTHTPLFSGTQNSLSANDINALKNTNLFNARLNNSEAPKVKSDNALICLDASKPSSLPLKVLNTVVLQDSVKSVAAVQVRNAQEPEELREGDKVENLAQVGKIDRLRLIIKNLQTGECEFLQSNEKDETPSALEILDANAGKAAMAKNRPEGIRNEGNKFFIKKSFRAEMMKNLGVVATQARAIPINNPDGSIAFKVTEVVPGSIYSYLNIQDNDIITHINGQKIESYNQIMDLYARIKDISHLSLTVQRDGTTTPMDYSFE